MDVKEAVHIALEYVNDLYSSEELNNLTLEEVELSEDEKNWLVTLGFTRFLSQPTSPPLQALTAPKSERVYKIFKIESETGKVLSMKMREI